MFATKESYTLHANLCAGTAPGVDQQSRFLARRKFEASNSGSITNSQFNLGAIRQSYRVKTGLSLLFVMVKGLYKLYIRGIRVPGLSSGS
jgi:hypothetical protein